MYKQLFFSALYITSILLSAPCYAEPKISVNEIPVIFTAKTDGVYDKIFSLFKSRGIRFSYDVLPPARAHYAFMKGDYDCVAPGDKDFDNLLDDLYTQGIKLIQSKAINITKVYIWSKEGTPPFTALDQLKGKVVGGQLGMPYGREFESSSLKLYRVKDVEANIKMLKKGRIDAFLAYTPDAWKAFDDLNIPSLSYSENNPVSVFRDAVLCRDNAEAQLLIDAINNAIDELRESGVLKEILGRSYIPS